MHNNIKSVAIFINLAIIKKWLHEVKICIIERKSMAIENLIENVDSQIIKIRTKSLDVSFNELYDMYKNNELTISPDYQRLFRWEEEKQSRFVESLILEMPVPPIFVIETDDGVYELIDDNQMKYGAELQSYKTGSVNGVKTRITLFTEGVNKILDGR